MTAPELSRSKFWRLIESARRESNSDLDRLVEILIEEMCQLTPEEILGAQTALEELLVLADQWELRGAAHIINNGGSNKSFDEFRGWLIAQGRAVFESALDDPETLLDVLESEARCAALLDAPKKAYRTKTGKKMPPRDPIEADPSGEEWEKADLADMFPRLWEEFSDEDED